MPLDCLQIIHLITSLGQKGASLAFVEEYNISKWTPGKAQML